MHARIFMCILKCTIIKWCTTPLYHSFRLKLRKKQLKIDVSSYFNIHKNSNKRSQPMKQGYVQNKWRGERQIVWEDMGQLPTKIKYYYTYDWDHCSEVLCTRSCAARGSSDSDTLVLFSFGIFKHLFILLPQH